MRLLLPLILLCACSGAPSADGGLRLSVGACAKAAREQAPDSEPVDAEEGISSIGFGFSGDLGGMSEFTTEFTRGGVTRTATCRIEDGEIVVQEITEEEP